MENLSYLISIISIVIFSLLYLHTEKLTNKLFNIQDLAVTFENAKLALDKLSSWTTWITSLQTAGIASLGFLLKDRQLECVGDGKTYAFFVLLFFGCSIILSTWILSAIPSIHQRLVKNNDEPTVQNDIFTLGIFSFIRYTIGRFSGLVHLYFLVGIIFYTLFMFSVFK